MNRRSITWIGTALACAVAAALSTIIDRSTATSNSDPKDLEASPEKHELSAGTESQKVALGAAGEQRNGYTVAKRTSRETSVRDAIAFVQGSKQQATVTTAEQALTILSSAAARDDLAALRLLARALREGKVLKGDPLRAFEYEVRAADLGDTGSAIAVGYVFAQGKGVSPNRDKATKYLKQGIAKKPHAGALKLLGDLYKDRSAAFYSLSESRHYYLAAAALGDHWALVELGKLSEESREPEWYALANGYYQRAFALGNAKALLLLGKLHLSNEAPIRDRKSAVNYFIRSAQAGDASAIAEIARMQKKGEIDSAERAAAIAALEELFTAHELEKEKRRLLGDLYRQSAGPEDRQLAVKNYMRAGELGDGWAMLALGDLDRASVDTFESAHKHYADAAEAGVARAYVRLGDMAVKRGSAEPGALSYYRLAMQNGDALGRLRVARTLQSKHMEQSAIREAIQNYRLSLEDIGVGETAKAMISGNRTGLISIVQILLEEAGYKIGKVDGILGNETYAQIAKFCRDRGLPTELLSEGFLEAILLSSGKPV